MLKVNASGDSISTTYFAGNHSTGFKNIITTGDGGYLLTGLAFDISSSNNSNCFLAKIAGTVLSVDHSLYQSMIKVYPNPVNEEVFFDLKNYTGKELNLILTNEKGNVVSQKIVPDLSGKFIYKTDLLEPGVYFYSLFCNEDMFSSGKLVVFR